jgi:hypothetical protein
MVKKVKHPQTAEELLRELHSDPAWVKQKDERNATLTRLGSENEVAEAPIVNALKMVGSHVNSVWDFANGAELTPQASAVLFDHITKPYPERVREGIARALTTPSSKVGWQILRDLFMRDPDTSGLGSKAAIGFALAACADSQLFDQLTDLIRDARHGKNRLALLAAFERFSDQKSLGILKELRDDPVVGPAAIKILETQLRRRDPGSEH